jgi:preprotein translocase subunit YajC
VVPDDSPADEESQGTQGPARGLAKGDEVVTQGGIVGKVTKVGDAYVTVEIAEGTEVVVQKPSIGLVLPKGTLKSL